MAVDLRKAHAEGLNGAVAAELRAEKAAQNLTNQDLADRSGIPIVSVQRYLVPKRAIDLVVLEQLAAAVGKTPAEIVEAAERRLARMVQDPAAGSGGFPASVRDQVEAEVAAAVDRVNARVRGTRPAAAHDTDRPDRQDRTGA